MKKIKEFWGKHKIEIRAAYNLASPFAVAALWYRLGKRAGMQKGIEQSNTALAILVCHNPEIRTLMDAAKQECLEILKE